MRGEYSAEEMTVRKSIRLGGYDYSQTGYYFVTVCIKDRHELLGKVVGATARHNVQSITQINPERKPPTH